MLLGKSFDLAHRRTCAAFLWTRILSIPFWVLLSALSVILYKEMHISLEQVTLLIALKPISALLAPYWSTPIYKRRDRLIGNLLWANSLRYVPFLFCPWIDSPWVLIAAFTLYMSLSRGAAPAWMELIKCNLAKESREKVFALGNTLEYFGTAIFPLAFGFLLDADHLSWRWLFPASALLGIGSTLLIFFLPPFSKETVAASSETIAQKLSSPYRRSWSLLKKRPDFLRYQLGFMLGGAGLMVLQPGLPHFFVDMLNLSYTEMLLAISVCKGVGFACSSPVWVRWFQKFDLYFFSSLVAFCASIFPFLLIAAHYQGLYLYAAYILYGAMQSGSELSWHMSGPIFAKDEDSSLFSSTNVLAVGLRGCLFPLLGWGVAAYGNPVLLMILGSSFCMLGGVSLIRSSKQAAPAEAL